MLVFVLEAQNDSNFEITRTSIAATLPQAQIVRVTQDAGCIMNATLEDKKACPEGWVLTLYAGDLLLSPFGNAVAGWMMEWPRDQGWLCITHPFLRQINQEHPQKNIILWRSEYLTSGWLGGFASREWLPFTHYVCLEKIEQATPPWRGCRRLSTDWLPGREVRSISPWERVNKEWELLSPLIACPTLPSAVESPLVTIALCTYNEAPYLYWAVRSVLLQTCSSWELIIVDDGSSDTTLEKLTFLECLDSRIRTVKNTHNAGKVHSLNQALKLARGTWLLELDTDDWLAADCLTVLLACVQHSAPEAGLWYGDYHEWVERYNGMLVYRGHVQSPQLLKQEALLEWARPLAPRLYQIEKLRQLGGWSTADPSQGRLYEDFELILRLLKSCSLVHVPYDLYHRRIRTNSITRRNAKAYSFWKEWAIRQHLHSGAEGGEG
jgi:O-antigen biosynthesis protein